ncbi:DVUA0089 family protein [Thalassorhabdomicrobium marinisediminis]|uniref:DVUA0089 family protein n=1 Tax=Thalassorhabdomicrobium marinisediminis TaxID=2170577 RepID=UPI002490AF06|nr:DVUA0089 family protein [Thalassorhabdomicrobium marinisediminis]
MPRSLSTALITGLFALAALPAAAQDDSLCGGIGAAGQWLGGEEGASDLATAPDYLEQMALVLMQNEYVGLFTVSEAGAYRIEAQGRGGGDTVLDLRNAAGELVASDDDSGGDAASRIETDLAAGTYCAALRSFDGTPLTGFLRAGRSEHEALTPGFEMSTPDDTGGCDMANAQALALGEPAQNPWRDQRYYRLSLDAPTSVTFTAENESADPILTLYDGNGGWLAENDDFDGLNSRIDIVEPLAAGDYCIAISTYGDETAAITVTAKAYDPMEVQRNLYDRGEASPPLDGAYPVTDLGELQTRQREDLTATGIATWYAFEVTQPGLVLVEAIAQGYGDPLLTMYDDLGRQVGYNDDSMNSLDSQLTVRVQAGTYLVAVKQVDSAASGPIRLLFERYVPAQP